MEIERQTGEGADALIEAVRRTLEDVRVSVEDWRQMREKMLEVAQTVSHQRIEHCEIDPLEAREFLQWAAENHFTFLGFREYRLVAGSDGQQLEVVPGTGLGLLRDEHHSARARPVKSLGRKQINRHELLILTKTAARSTVHRSTYMDYIGVLRYDADGNAVGEYRFIGLLHDFSL